MVISLGLYDIQYPPRELYINASPNHVLAEACHCELDNPAMTPHPVFILTPAINCLFMVIYYVDRVVPSLAKMMDRGRSTNSEPM